MTSFTVDWQRKEGNVTTEMQKNHFKFSPLNIRTKNGSIFEMDARMMMEIDDDSIIVKNFGSFPEFVDNTLSILVMNFFTYKEEKYLLMGNLKIQEELVTLLQEKLGKYGTKITTFMVVHMSMLPPFGDQDEEQRTTIKEIHHAKDIQGR